MHAGGIVQPQHFGHIVDIIAPKNLIISHILKLLIFYFPDQVSEGDVAATTAHAPSNEATPEPTGTVLMIEVGSFALIS